MAAGSPLRKADPEMEKQDALISICQREREDGVQGNVGFRERGTVTAPRALGKVSQRRWH